MVVRTGFGTPCDACEIPSVELAGKAGKLGLFKVLGKDLRCETFLLINHETSAVW